MKKHLLLCSFLSCLCIVVSFTLSGVDKGVWLDVQNSARNAVVQVIAQVGQFNWVEPYKTLRQGELRGSGFFINDRGEFITNFHVINEAKRIWIYIPAFGKKRLHAQTVSVAPERDLALVRLNPESLAFIHKNLGAVPYLSLGDSDAVRRTHDVLVLGYPLGYHHLKSSTGIVSGREFAYDQSYLQVTAPINEGNSGGPLLNTKGQVIGINTAAVPAAENVGYSIPVNELNIILDDFYQKPFVRKPRLGVLGNNASEYQAAFLHNPTPGAFYINKVFKNSLAEKIDLHAGDVIYEFNGFTLDEYGDTAVTWNEDKVPLRAIISRLNIDEQVNMVVYRNGKRLDFTFAFELMPPYPIRRMYPDYEPVEYEVIGGMVVMQLTNNNLRLLGKKNPYLIKYTRLENKSKPVLVVSNILPGSTAQQVDAFGPGAVISQVNGVFVRTLPEFRTALQTSMVSQFLTIKTEDDVFVVFPFDQVLADELRLSRDFVYPITDTVKQFLQETIHGKKKNSTRPISPRAHAAV